MKTVRAMITKLSPEAARPYLELRADEIPCDIVRDGEGGVYHLYPHRGHVPDHVFDGLVRMIESKQKTGDRIEIVHSSENQSGLKEDILIENLGFNNRVMNALYSAGYRTVGDLAKASRTELLATRGIGLDSYKRIKEVMDRTE